jgi:hypothetical protein
MGRVLDRLFLVLCSDHGVSRRNGQSVHWVVHCTRQKLLSKLNTKLNLRKKRVMCSKGQMGSFGISLETYQEIKMSIISMLARTPTSFNLLLGKKRGNKQ